MKGDTVPNPPWTTTKPTEPCRARIRLGNGKVVAVDVVLLPWLCVHRVGSPDDLVLMPDIADYTEWQYPIQED